jgi:hypothetical protein
MQEVQFLFERASSKSVGELDSKLDASQLAALICSALVSLLGASKAAFTLLEPALVAFSALVLGFWDRAKAQIFKAKSPKTESTAHAGESGIELSGPEQGNSSTSDTKEWGLSPSATDPSKMTTNPAFCKASSQQPGQMSGEPTSV